MVRKTLVLIAVLTAVMSGLFIATQETALAAPIATGTATCPVTSGSGRVIPGLSAAGILGPVTIGYTAKFGQVGRLCGGAVVTPAGVKITGGTVTGTGHYTPPGAGHGSSCVNFDGPDKVLSIKETIVWTTIGGPIANTTVTYTGNVASTTGPFNGLDTLTLKAPFGVKVGSFAVGPLVTSKFVTTLPAPGLNCVGTTVNFKITGGAIAM